jgi:uncharacterized membrane protein YqaE (UPF0057 family)
MRAIIILSLGAFIILSACSTKLSVVKRRYSSGYYVTVTKKKAENKAAESRNMNPVTENEIRFPVTEIMAINESTAPAIIVPVSTLMSPVKSTKLHNSIKLPLLASLNYLPTRQPRTFAPLVNVKKLNKPKSTGEMDFIIMVILCFFPFINLIPVYLHDSRAIGLNFWITLILDCILFVPGIIFALLVILNIVDIH